MSRITIGAALSSALVGLVYLVPPAHADGIEVAPLTTLPPAPTLPSLWFDGGAASTLPDLTTRRTHARTAAFYTTFKAYVDARLGSIAGSTDDDTRSKFAKAAALLDFMQVTPTAGGPYTRYRDAAVVAISGVGNRQAVDSVPEFISAPSDAINILQDASRLQSLAEAYDLLRGSGVASADDVAMRGRIAMWANAIATDWNLLGAFGVPGHRDNWAIKGGAALLTVALALPEHANANTWRASGMTYINESLAAVASETGWYRESAWYLNYSLANLWSTAWHVNNATGIDWFPALRPFVEASLAWRQPSGHAPPFEEGLRNTFPWDVVASAYPDLAPQILWAWDSSDENTENFEVQQHHDVTRFIVNDLTSATAAPTWSSTRFLDGDTRLYALATDWSADALQVTGITAVDHSTSEANNSRHNMRNPLDLVLHGGGALVVPTASGGPTVTSSGNRLTYLSPRAKNIPLLAKNAPFIIAATPVDFGDRVDSDPASGNHYADLVRTAVRDAYAAGSTFARGVALIDLDYVIVADRMSLATPSELDLSWRGRGARTTRSATDELQAFTWTGGSRPTLDLDVVGSAPLTFEDNPSSYAQSWGVEESVAGVLVGADASEAAFISVFQVGAASARVVVSVGDVDAAAARVIDGAVEDAVVVPAASGVQSVAAVNVGTDGAMAIVRRDAGALDAFCLQHGTTLLVDGDALVSASGAVTLCATMRSDGGLVAEISPDSPGLDVVIDLPLDEGDYTFVATLDGAPATFSVEASGLRFAGLGAGTLIVTAEERGDPCADAATRCDDDDLCTTDGCNALSGACTHDVVTCPAASDAACGGTVRCVAATGCGFVDGPIADDGLFCTVGERCTGGVWSASARDCGEPDDQCALASVCDEAADACRDEGQVACTGQRFYIGVVDAEGVSRSIRCTVDGDEVSCETKLDGTLELFDEGQCE